MSPLAKGLTRHFSAARLERLAATRVGIAGAGGLGSNCAVALVRSGLRRLTLVDMDRVEPSNLNRQAFFPEHLGRTKVDALAEQLLRLEPALELDLHETRLTAANTAAIFADCPIVVEALDNPADKAMLFGVLGAAGHMLVGASGIAGCGGPAMTVRRLGQQAVIVGDFTSSVDDTPPLAPRVLQAAALQADTVLEYIVKDTA